MGYNSYGTVSKCYATGTVSGVFCVGGLVGYRYYGTVSNCYASGSVSGGYWYVGGLVGWNNSTISNCYATGSVSGSSIVGGLVGYDYFGTVTASFWDIDTSGQAISAGGTGKTTVQMQTQSTFTDAGWNFVEIWGIRREPDVSVFKGLSGRRFESRQPGGFPGLCDFRQSLAGRCRIASQPLFDKTMTKGRFAF